MGISSFKELDVCQRARERVLAIYRLTQTFPKHQIFSLTAQMQRAALSIPANVAEGFGRRMPKGKAHFHTIAKGSAEELECYLLIARDLGYSREETDLLRKIDIIGRMLRRLTERTLEGP